MTHLVVDDEVIQPAEELLLFRADSLAVRSFSYLTFEVSHPAPEVTEPPALSSGNLVFGCLASSYKITPPVVEAWSRILRGAPGARLFPEERSLLAAPRTASFLPDASAQYGN